MYPAGMTALHIAVQQGRTEIVQLLLQRGADPNVLDVQGLSALDRAYGSHHEEYAEALRKHGARDWLLGSLGQPHQDAIKLLQKQAGVVLGHCQRWAQADALFAASEQE
jgi:ankyrin repeat protein